MLGQFEIRRAKWQDMRLPVYKLIPGVSEDLKPESKGIVEAVKEIHHENPDCRYSRTHDGYS